jgi:hypothetical protein
MLRSGKTIRIAKLTRDPPKILVDKSIASSGFRPNTSFDVSPVHRLFLTGSGAGALSTIGNAFDHKGEFPSSASGSGGN